MQSQLNESQLSCSVSVEPTDDHQRESAGIDRTGKFDQKSMATVLYSLVHDDQQPRREDSRRFSMEVEQKVERRIASRFPKIEKTVAGEPIVEPEREVEPFESIKTAVMAA